MNFLADLVKRLFSKTPKFFTYVKWVLAAVAVITGLPVFLENAGIILPEAWAGIANKIVSIATAVGAFVAQLAVTDSTEEDLTVK